MTLFSIMKYFLIFLFYAFLGWILESLYVSTVEAVKEKRRWKFINRGFLTGPVTPIYGVCGMIMILALVPVRDSYWKTILLGVLLCDGVEYFTSWIMEKLFHARWWDYTGKPGNINGRIDLKHSLIWAGFSVFFTKIIWPVTTFLFAGLETRIGWNGIFGIFTVTLVLFAVDLYRTVVASISITKLQAGVEKVRTSIKEFDPKEALLDSNMYQSAQASNAAAKESVDRVRESIRLSSSWRRRHIKQIVKTFPALGDYMIDHLKEIDDLPAPDELHDALFLLKMDLGGMFQIGRYEMY